MCDAIATYFVMYLYRGYSTSITFGKGERVDKKSDKKITYEGGSAAENVMTLR